MRRLALFAVPFAVATFGACALDLEGAAVLGGALDGDGGPAVEPPDDTVDASMPSMLDATVGAGDATKPPVPGDASIDDASVNDAHLTDAHASDASDPHDANDAAILDAGADARDSAPAPHPQSCADVITPILGAAQTFYVNGDPNKPWTGYCVGAATYLPVPASNVSVFPAGSCAAGTSITTTWSMVRFDPATLFVDTSDFTGSTSMGAVTETSTAPYTHVYDKMPFASARTCQTNSAAVATVDLTGTKFMIAGGQTFTGAGYMDNPTSMFGPMRKTATLSISGYPSGISPCSNDYYTNVGGACLKLDYAPGP